VDVLGCWNPWRVCMLHIHPLCPHSVSHLVDAREKLAQVGLDDRRVLGLSQNFKQVLVTQKVKPDEFVWWSVNRMVSAGRWATDG
jgi:hypothetical protein